MTFEEAKQYCLYQEPEFLRRAKNIGNKKSYVCPCCENGSRDSGTGITKINESSSHPAYHCFSCDMTGDIFDLAKEYYGSSSTKDAFQAVYDYFGLEVNGQPAQGTHKQNLERINKTQKEMREKIKEDEPEVDYTQYLKRASYFLDPTYLMNRGLSEKTQRHYMIGTDKKWLNPTVVNNYKKEGKSLKTLWPSPRCIIPTSQHSYLARDTRDDLSEKQKEYAKQKVGKVSSLFNEKFSSRKSIIFATEGEIDAMSFFEASNGYYEATGLGSTSNWSKFVAKCSIGGPFYGKPVVLAMDNDEPGRKVSEKIKTELEKKGVPVVNMIYDGKDPNASLVKNRYAFSKAIKNAVIEVKALQEALQENLNKEEKENVNVSVEEMEI